MPHRRPIVADARQAGLTLVEVLVALVILGFVLVAVAQGMQLGLRSTAVAHRIAAGTSQLESTARLLRQLIARMAPQDPYGQPPAFIGTSHLASFVTMLPDPRGSGSLALEAEVALGVGAGHALQLRWRPHHRRWIATPPPPAVQTLADGVERLDISYWLADPGAWVGTWTGPGLPRLVRFRLIRSDGTAPWPDIVAAPMREAPLQ